MFGLVSQEHAALEVHMYTPLVKVQCSPHLKEFLCAAYVPMCSPTMRTPCRELCQSARAGCENLMVDFGFEWPGKLACESFPSSQEDMDCYIGSLQDGKRFFLTTQMPCKVLWLYRNTDSILIWCSPCTVLCHITYVKSALSSGAGTWGGEGIALPPSHPPAPAPPLSLPSILHSTQEYAFLVLDNSYKGERNSRNYPISL